MRNWPKMLRNRICAAFLLICVSVTTSSCQALLMIPILILQLPFIILSIAFKLLPYVIKFAPLALLFIENTDENAAECYAYLPANATMVDVNARVTCYLVPLDDKDKATLLAHEVAAKGGRMVFVKEASFVDSPDVVADIYTSMKRNDIQFAYDARIVEKDVEADIAYNV